MGSIKVTIDLYKESYRPRMLLPFLTCFYLEIFIFRPSYVVTFSVWFVGPNMLAFPELVRFSMWPLFCLVHNPVLVCVSILFLCYGHGIINNLAFVPGDEPLKPLGFPE